VFFFHWCAADADVQPNGTEAVYAAIRPDMQEVANQTPVLSQSDAARLNRQVCC
jgi:hypothetical protein